MAGVVSVPEEHGLAAIQDWLMLVLLPHPPSPCHPQPCGSMLAGAGHTGHAVRLRIIGSWLLNAS